MNTLIIHESYLQGVKKLIAFSSVCAFPSELKVLDEVLLHKGEPFPAHRSYAYSKRMIDIQIESYNKQYNTNFCSVIPGNIFGKKDNFNLEHGHVVPSLIHRCFLAKNKNISLKVWGNGEPMREFIYSNDIARACIDLIQQESLPQKIIVSGKKEYRIKDIVNIICDIFNYNNVEWLTEKPNGQMRRPSKKDVFNRFLTNFEFTDMKTSLSETIDWFKENYPEVRR
jgi:GDP-L-fucose synthase